MTDKHEPGDAAPPPEPAGSDPIAGDTARSIEDDPMAGRPAPDAWRDENEDEPVAGQPAPDAWRDEDDEVTTRLTPPAVDDEPTVERPKPFLRPRADDEDTRRLRPPVVVPGPDSDTPGIAGPEDAGPPIGGPMLSASDATAGWPRDVEGGPAGSGQAADAAAADITAAGGHAEEQAWPERAEELAQERSWPERADELDLPGRAGERARPERAEDDAAGEAGEPAVSPDPVTAGDDVRVVPEGSAPGVPGKDWPFKKFVSAGVLIWVLLALFGFTLVVQLRSNNSDEGLASARQDDLVRILSDLEARDTRLQAEIAALETSQRQLTSGVAGRQAALAEAEKRAGELGLLAGTLPGTGRGLDIKIDGVRASAILNAVQELRGAGGEVMQLSGADGSAVRIVASTYFVDAEGGGIVADGKRLTGPYELLVIGVPQTMQTALEIPGGVVASVKSGGGSVTMEQRDAVDVTALRVATSLQFARPVS